MNDFMIHALQEGMKILLIIITPTLLIPMVICLVISILQAVTQVQDQLLNFLPKLITVLLIVMFGTPLMLKILSNYLSDILIALPQYL